MKPIPLVRKAVLAPAISYLVSEGVPVARHLHRAKLLAPTPETLESLMPLHQLCDFLHSVARSEGIDDLGFHIAGQLGIESLGAYGKLAAQAFTFHESILFGRELISKLQLGSENLDRTPRQSSEILPEVRPDASHQIQPTKLVIWD